MNNYPLIDIGNGDMARNLAEAGKSFPLRWIWIILGLAFYPFGLLLVLRYIVLQTNKIILTDKGILFKHLIFAFRNRFIPFSEIRSVGITSFLTGGGNIYGANGFYSVSHSRRINSIKGIMVELNSTEEITWKVPTKQAENFAQQWHRLANDEI